MFVQTWTERIIQITDPVTHKTAHVIQTLKKKKKIEKLCFAEE